MTNNANSITKTTNITLYERRLTAIIRMTSRIVGLISLNSLGPVCLISNVPIIEYNNTRAIWWEPATHADTSAVDITKRKEKEDATGMLCDILYSTNNMEIKVGIIIIGI